MRRWGIVIGLLYALILVGLLIPAGVYLVGGYNLFSPDFMNDLRGTYIEPTIWIPAIALVLSQLV